MGETQIYSQRLHGITEKRRILGEMDSIQREMELQKVKLQQLKRKSLRDRWLMDGMVPAPGAELENPLSETEDKIKKLEDDLESLQLQLRLLENPGLKIENLKKHQGSNPQKSLVNGDQNQEISDQNDPTAAKREIHKDIKEVIQEENLQPNGEDEKHEEVVDPIQKDPTLNKDVMVGHPIPAPRGIRVSGNYLKEKNKDQTSSDQKLDIVDRRNEERDNEIENGNRSLESQDEEFENLGPNEERKDESLNREHVPIDQDLLKQSSECLDKRLEHGEENVEHLTKGIEHGDLSFNAETLNADVSRLTVSNEDLRTDLDNQFNMVKIRLLDESKQHESETLRSPAIETQYEDKVEILVRSISDDNSQDSEKNPVLIIQDQNEEITVPVGNQDQNEEFVLPRCQVEPVDPMPVLIGYDKDHDLDSTSFPAHQGLVVLSSDQEQSRKLPCNEPDLTVSLPCEDLVSQVQISQVVVISPPGHTSSGELAQHSSNSQHGLSTDHHRSGTTETSTPAESKPLLHKPTETDAQLGEHGTNTAETRDKNPPVKKKSCQCCVVM